MSCIKKGMEKTHFLAHSEYSCILVSGPRQSGKTTLRKRIMGKGRHVASLDDFDEHALEQNGKSVETSS